MSEHWRSIPGFPGYEASDLGRIRSFRSRHGMQANPKNLKPGVMAKGHLLVALRRTGRTHSRCVHRLVLETFVGPRPRGQQARHVNERDPSNNRLDNLAWGTPADNEADKTRHGTSQHGERNHQAKLTNVEAARIRTSTTSGKSLATLFGVSKSVISQIRTGKRYRDLHKNKVPS